MSQGNWEREEYLEPNDDELENAARIKKLVVLAIMAVLVIAGVMLANRLRDVSELQDCLMTKATNCAEINAPPPHQR